MMKNNKKQGFLGHSKRNLIFRGIIVGLLGIYLFLNIALAESPVAMKFKRNNGTDMGDNLRIEGDWTITATGTDEIIRMELYFNDNKTFEANNNSFSFRFNTRNYAIGTTNITLIGYSSDGSPFQDTQIREFMDPAETDRFLYIMLSVTGVIVVLSVAIAIIAKKKQKNQPKPTKSDVQIGDL